MNSYTSGDWTIEQDQLGHLEGMRWGLWLGTEFIADTKTLKSAKRIAASKGQVGEWAKSKITVELVKE